MTAADLINAFRRIAGLPKSPAGPERVIRIPVGDDFIDRVLTKAREHKPLPEVRAMLGGMNYDELCAFFLVDPDSTTDPGAAILAEAILLREELERASR